MVKVTRQSFIDHVQVRVTHSTPSGESFVSIIGVDLDPVDTKSPTANNSTNCTGLTSPNNAHASDNAYATATADIGTFQTMYLTFGFAIPAGNTIDKVELLLESKSNTTGVTHQVEIGTPGSPDNCGNFQPYVEGSASGSVADPTTEAVRVFDVTSTGHPFVPSDFDNANLRFQMTCIHGAA